MPDRFVFRQVDFRDLPTFIAAGEIRAKNHPSIQRCHQASHGAIVSRRGTTEFCMPLGGVVNDYVAFYFSPLTSFSFGVNRGSVEVFSPSGENLGASKLDDRVFLVSAVASLYAAELECCFSNFALNSKVPEPTVVSDPELIETHIDWSMFDESPMTAGIAEIGYAGVCKYFNSPATPERYQLRKPIRMAEFLVKTAVPLKLLVCIVVPTEAKRVLVQGQITAAGLTIPVLTKPGCFVS